MDNITLSYNPVLLGWPVGKITLSLSSFPRVSTGFHSLATRDPRSHGRRSSDHELHTDLSSSPQSAT